MLQPKGLDRLIGDNGVPNIKAFGDLDRKTIRMLERLADDAADKSAANGSSKPGSDGHAESKVSSVRAAYEPLILKPGALLIREWQGRLERVIVVDDARGAFHFASGVS